MNLFKKIIEKAKQAIRGEGRLWKVFLLWGILLYVVSYLIELSNRLFLFVYGETIAKYLFGIVGVCGVILLINKFKKIIEKAKQAIRGDERLWRVFWLWGILFYVVSYLIGFCSIYFPLIVGKTIGLFLFGIVGVCGVILLFVYPIIWIISMWRCRKNINGKTLQILTFFSSVYFLYIQYLGAFYVMFLSAGYVMLFLNFFK